MVDDGSLDNMLRRKREKKAVKQTAATIRGQPIQTEGKRETSLVDIPTNSSDSKKAPKKNLPLERAQTNKGTVGDDERATENLS